MNHVENALRDTLERFEKLEKRLLQTRRNLEQDKKVNGYGLFEPYIGQIDEALEIIGVVHKAATPLKDALDRDRRGEGNGDERGE